MSNAKTTVIYHRADFDGIFCREIARKFLVGNTSPQPSPQSGEGEGSVEFIGWDFGDPPLAMPDSKTIYVMDLPVDRVFGLSQPLRGVEGEVAWDYIADYQTLIWIDHHKSSIETHPASIPGYRIDGVSACRLAWQWFSHLQVHERPEDYPLPEKQHFVDRNVSEPIAVRMAGEYDVWDKRDPFAEVFQFGLCSYEHTADVWENLLGENENTHSTINVLLRDGTLLQRYQQQSDASVVNFRSFVLEFEGLKFLALNTARCNSLTFAARDITETGHDALMGFFFNGEKWKFSLYHARNLTGHDLSAIAVKYGGGGHRGASGFEMPQNRISITDGKLIIHPVQT